MTQIKEQEEKFVEVPTKGSFHICLFCKLITLEEEETGKATWFRKRLLKFLMYFPCFTRTRYCPLKGAWYGYKLSLFGHRGRHLKRPFRWEWKKSNIS
jgi:hypothetical protein